MKKIIISAVILVLIIGLVVAQPQGNRGATMRERLERVERRLDDFDARLRILEEKMSSATSSLQNVKSDLEIEIEGMLARGTIYDMSLEFGQIRIHPDSWNDLDMLQKKALVRMFSDYMFLKTNNRSVLVLEGNSHKSLARYNPEISDDIKITDLADENTPPEPENEAKSLKKISPNVIRQEIFGINLGESLISLKKRKTVSPSRYAYTDEDYPGQMWDVENHDSSVKTLSVTTYQNMIYEITVYFTDASQTNYDVIKKQLQEKYADKGDEGLVETLFSEIRLQSTIDNVQLLITLNYDDNVFGENEMTLRYIHTPVFEMARDEMKRRKAAKITDKL